MGIDLDLNNPLSPEDLSRAIKKEREWLAKYNAVSAVTDGPVEDQQGVPLPADEFQGTPALVHRPEGDRQRSVAIGERFLLPEVLGDEGGGGISSGGQPGNMGGVIRRRAQAPLKP